jgi:enoyl-CoA hydratase/carnithine racemase
MILSGRTVAADEALAIGLVDQVLDDAVLLEVAVAAGLRYARGPLALRHAKRAVDAALDLPVEAGLALEADLITRCFGSEDGQRGQRGLRSFVDQGPRKATFLGR